jgi:hypothetical protein
MLFQSSFIYAIDKYRLFVRFNSLSKNALQEEALTAISSEERKLALSSVFAFYIRIDPKNGRWREHEHTANPHGSKDPGYGYTPE